MSIRVALSDAVHAGRHALAERVAARSILGNGARVMGIQWIEAALGAVYFAVVARFLGPALYGNWAYGIAACTLIAGIAGLGFDALIILRLGREKRGGGDFLGVVLTLRLLLLVLGAIALALYALLAEPDSLNRFVLLLLLPALLGRGMAVAVRNCFIAYERMADYARFVALFRGIEVGCGIAYLLAGGGLIGILVLHAVLWVSEACFGLWRIRRRLARYAPRFRWQPALGLLAEAAVLGVSASGFNWLVSGPIMLLGHTAIGFAQLGQFAIASSLTMILVSSAHAFFVAALPVLSRGPLQAGETLVFARMATVGIAVAGAGAAGSGWLLGPMAVAWGLGPGYAEAGSLLAPFLLIGALILAPTGYEQVLLVAGRRWALVLAYLAGGMCLAAGFFPAVAVWGLDAAVAATAAGWFLRGAVLIGMAEFDAFRLRHRRPTMAVPLAPGEDQLA